MVGVQQTLRDIQGLDPVSWWPPGPGWWILLTALLLGSGILVWFRRYRRRAKTRTPGWKPTLLRELLYLQRELENESIPPETTRALLLQFLELMKRSAILAHGRSTCAGLWGEAWPQWLQNRDASGFSWETYEAELIHMPYDPAAQVDPRRLRELIRAAERWITDLDV